MAKSKKSKFSREGSKAFYFKPIAREVNISRVDENLFKHLMKVGKAVFTPNGVKKQHLFLEREQV